MSVAHVQVIDGVIVVSFNGQPPVGFLSDRPLSVVKSVENGPMRRPESCAMTKRMDSRGKRSYKGRQFQRHAS